MNDRIERFSPLAHQQPQTERIPRVRVSDHDAGEIVHLPGDRCAVTGTPGEVGQLLAVIQRTGRLVASTMPTPTGIPGQVMVTCRLLPEQRPRARSLGAAEARRRMPVWGWFAVAAAVLGVLAGLGWGIYCMVSAVVATAAGHGAAIAGGVVLLVLLLFAGGGACKTVITIKHHH